MRLITPLLTIVLTLGFAASSEAKRPHILIGFDAQPIENFEKVKSLGANALVRYESGPQKNVSVQDWIAAANRHELYVIVQGDAIEAAGMDMKSLPKNVIAVAQNDEPDLNRWDARDKTKPDSFYAPLIYSDKDAPHPSMKGWTRAEQLQTRYDRWRAVLPKDIPITVNFAGPHLSDGWYQDGKKHAAYIAASDEQGADWYPRNFFPQDDRPLYLPSLVVDKIALFGGKPTHFYLECSHQRYRGKRGPNPAEQSTMFWSMLGHGANGIFYFPQAFGPFTYFNVSEENQKQAKTDNALVAKHDELIGTGKRTLVQDPQPQISLAKGALVWPETETVTWTKGNETLTVKIDMSGETAPVVEYKGPGK